MPTMEGRITIRREKGSGAPGDPLQPYRPRSRTIEPWVLEGAAGSTLAKLEQAYMDALAAVDAVEDRKASAFKSGKFTSQGVVDDALMFAASTCAPKLRRARQVLEAARQEAADRRAKFALKPTDKTDAAGQMRRLWKLDRLAKMLDSERNAYIAKNIDNLDPELEQAILEMPEFSSLLPSDIEQIRDCALRTQYGDKVFSEQRDLEAGIAIVEQVLPLAREAIAQDVGGETALAAAAAPYERAATAPWLRKIQRTEPDPEKGGHPFVKVAEEYIGVWQERVGFRRATESEIANGIYYPDHAAYVAAQNGDLSRVPSEKQNGAGGAGADIGAVR